MWTYNVARALLTAAGRRPWPALIPPNPIPAFREAVRQGVAPDEVICVKMHARFEGALPGVRIICNIRDVRDAIVSFMRFEKTSFEGTLESYRDSLGLVDYYLGNCPLPVHCVRYEEMTTNPAETVTRIGSFIGFPAGDEVAVRIAEGHSRERVRQRMAALDSAEGMIGTISNADGSTRRYDFATGFQSGHVSDSRGGEWREVLTQAQQARLLEVTGDWLVRHGYTP